MASPLWIPGKSANPSGRPKHSVRTVKGMVERFVKRNITPNKLQKMFDALTDTQKLDMLTELLPYVAPKMGTTDGLSATDIDTLYDNLMKAIEGKTNAKAS
jgi:hypothetical protein